MEIELLIFSVQGFQFPNFYENEAKRDTTQ